MMFDYTITVTRNGKLTAVFHPKTRAQALDTLRNIENYVAKQSVNGYAITLTVEET